MLGVFRVEEFVTIESMQVGEGFAADLALEGPIFVVNPHMQLQSGFLETIHVAYAAYIILFDSRGSLAGSRFLIAV